MHPEQTLIAATPPAPYYAVIFTSLRHEGDGGYASTAQVMGELAASQAGYLGIESARETLGITVSYWDSLESIRRWKAQADHQIAQRLGREKWYSHYHVRICRVERDYSFQDGSPF